VRPATRVDRSRSTRRVGAYRLGRPIAPQTAVDATRGRSQSWGTRPGRPLGYCSASAGSSSIPGSTPATAGIGAERGKDLQQAPEQRARQGNDSTPDRPHPQPAHLGGPGHQPPVTSPSTSADRTPRTVIVRSTWCRASEPPRDVEPPGGAVRGRAGQVHLVPRIRTSSRCRAARRPWSGDGRTLLIVPGLLLSAPLQARAVRSRWRAGRERVGRTPRVGLCGNCQPVSAAM